MTGKGNISYLNWYSALFFLRSFYQNINLGTLLKREWNGKVLSVIYLFTVMLLFWVKTSEIIIHLNFQSYSIEFNRIPRKYHLYVLLKKYFIYVSFTISQYFQHMFRIWIFLRNHWNENNSINIIVWPTYPSLSWLLLRSSITFHRIYV